MFPSILFVKYHHGNVIIPALYCFFVPSENESSERAWIAKIEDQKRQDIILCKQCVAQTTT